MKISVDQAFAPPGEGWVSVSPKLTTARRLVLVLVLIPLLAVAIIVLAVAGQGLIAGLMALGGLLLLIYLWWLIGRRVRSFGYVEREDDLLVTSGILFRRLAIVPYGRMQLVDLVAGPIDRSMGLATVQLHTAAATSDAKIPGLQPEVAAGLRDRLAKRGEGRSAGL
ncbi:MAG: PH domain-containing protein [Actinomycetia bacterium]|nr:PH domain-containing protein [Actinomycetes bacterium]